MIPRRPTVLLLVSAAALGAAVVASAASLGLVPARLTSYGAASTVAASTCSLAASAADAYVDGAALQTNSNFGGSPDLWVRSSALGDRRSFVRFDLSGCGIPASARVTGATFSLFMSQAPSSSRSYEARRVSAAWVESTVTWSNQPAVAGAATATTTGTTAGVTLSWPVTSDVQSFVAGSATNNGWRVADSSEGALSAVSSVFGSRERATAGERPTLVVTYYP
jgi:hypothetical protein